MAQEERFATRDRSYSAWHRRESTRRFVGLEQAQSLAMIDIDASLFVEYDDGTKEPIALIETAMDRGQDIKPATVTKNLARRCSPEIRAYIVLYKVSQSDNPADPTAKDIDGFRVRRIWPEPETPWKTMTPSEWAHILVKIRNWSVGPLDGTIG